MKKQLVALVILVAVLAGGHWLYRYYRSVCCEPPIPTIDQQTNSGSPVAAPGTYVVYQETRIIDRGPKDWANDDVDQTDIYAQPIDGGQKRLLTSIKADESFGGSVWSEVVGQQVLVHRYSASQDAYLDLDGTVHLVPEAAVEKIVSRDGSDWVKYTLNYENRGAVVSMTTGSKEQDAYLATHPEADVLPAFVLDPAELGIEGPGYAVPFMISDDGEQVYIHQLCDCDGGPLYGFWTFDVDTQTLHKVDYVTEHRIGVTNLNPATKQLIGVEHAYNGPETDFGGPAASPPSTVYLVDLETREGKSIFSSNDFIVGNDFLSPDGTQYASDFGDEVIRIREVGAPFDNSDVTVSGIVMAWVDNTLVIIRDGDIILYDLVTQKVMTVAESVGGSYIDPDRVVAQFAGVIQK